MNERPPYLDEPRWPTDGVPPPAPVAHDTGARRNRRKLIIGGVAAACALGLGMGLLARPSFRDNPDQVAPKRDAAASDGQIQIVRRPGTPQPSQVAPVQAVAVDDAQPADTVTAAPMVQATAPTPLPEPVRPTPVSRPRPVIEPAPRRAEPSFDPGVPVRINPRPMPAERRRDADDDGFVARRVSRPSFNCRQARTESERLVCGDQRLAAYDRRLNRAFNQAVRSGVSYRELRREQDRWLRARENAARQDPAAVADVYRSRIGELEDMAGG